MESKDGTMTGIDRRDDGVFTETYPPEDFLDALREHGETGTSDIAEHIDCSYETAYKKLRTLQENDKVTSRKIGNTRLWKVNNK